MEKSKKEEHSENSTLKWFIQVFTMTFILSIIFSYISTNGVSNLSLIPACLILVLVIATGTYISDGAVEEEISQGVGRIAGNLGLNNLIKAIKNV